MKPRIKWHKSSEGYIDSKCGIYHIRPLFWGRCNVVEYELRKGAGYGVYVGRYTTQKEAKEAAFMS